MLYTIKKLCYIDFGPDMAERRKNMTSKEIHILREINENHAAYFAQCEDIRERTIRLNTLNSIMNDIIDLIILGSEENKR